MIVSLRTRHSPPMLQEAWVAALCSCRDNSLLLCTGSRAHAQYKVYRHGNNVGATAHAGALSTSAAADSFARRALLGHETYVCPCRHCCGSSSSPAWRCCHPRLRRRLAWTPTLTLGGAPPRTLRGRLTHLAPRRFRRQSCRRRRRLQRRSVRGRPRDPAPRRSLRLSRRRRRGCQQRSARGWRQRRGALRVAPSSPAWAPCG